MKYSKRLAMLLEDWDTIVDVLSNDPAATAVIAHHLPGDKGDGKPRSSSSSTSSTSTKDYSKDSDWFITGESKSDGFWSSMASYFSNNKELMFIILLKYLVLRYILTTKKVSVDDFLSDNAAKIKEITITERKQITKPQNLTNLLKTVFDTKIVEINSEDIDSILKSEAQSQEWKSESRSFGNYDNWINDFIAPYMRKEKTK